MILLSSVIFFGCLLPISYGKTCPEKHGVFLSLEREGGHEGYCFVIEDLENGTIAKDIQKRRCCADYFLLNNTCYPCPPGTFGPNCATICPPGYYGEFCRAKCSDCRSDQHCHFQLGCCDPEETMNDDAIIGIIQKSTNIIVVTIVASTLILVVISSFAFALTRKEVRLLKKKSDLIQLNEQFRVKEYTESEKGSGEAVAIGDHVLMQRHSYEEPQDVRRPSSERGSYKTLNPQDVGVHEYEKSKDGQNKEYKRLDVRHVGRHIYDVCDPGEMEDKKPK